MFGSNRSQSSHERTAQERERAREERERRRAGRGTDGGASPAEPAGTDATLTEVEYEPPVTVHTDQQAAPVEDVIPAVESAAVAGPVDDWMDSPVDEQPPIEDPSPVEETEDFTMDLPIEDAAIDLDPIEPPSPVEHSDSVELPGHVEFPDPVEHAYTVEHADPVELPVAVKLPPPPPTPERIPPPPTGSGRKRRGSDPVLARRADRLREQRSSGRGPGLRITRARAAALLVLVVVLAVAWFLLSLFQPFAGSGHGSVIVTIPKGSGSGKVGSILAREGVVSSSFFFQARALVEGKRGDLHSGRFQMRHDMSYAAAISTLSKPPPRVIAIKVTIPEGETRRQIADIAHADGLSGSYLVASVRSARLDPAHYGAPKSTPNLEGFLFPATYELHAGAPQSLLVAEQLAAFRRHFGATEIHAAHTLHLTPYELLTVASMIEREAEVARDRPLVAAVIYNRLRLGMTLGIDATIRYALRDYSEPLTEAQLKLDSPYNTRLHTGLPPTPISNPGEASILAAAHPAHVPYLYYVAAADGCGAQVFSTSFTQFQHDAAAYQQAIAKNHGRVPTCKK